MNKNTLDQLNKHDSNLIISNEIGLGGLKDILDKNENERAIIFSADVDAFVNGINSEVSNYNSIIQQYKSRLAIVAVDSIEEVKDKVINVIDKIRGSDTSLTIVIDSSECLRRDYNLNTTRSEQFELALKAIAEVNDCNYKILLTYSFLVS